MGEMCGDSLERYFAGLGGEWRTRKRVCGDSNKTEEKKIKDQYQFELHPELLEKNREQLVQPTSVRWQHVRKSLPGRHQQR